MAAKHTAAAGPRDRETCGRFFEDFAVGDVYPHWPGRTISETDNTWFTLLTMNTHPLHFDAAYAAGSEFGRPLVNSCLTLSMVVGMSVRDLSQNAVANLGWDKIKLTAPVFVGDTIYAQSEVLDTRLSRSRPNQGIVTVLTTGRKADDTAFMHFERAFLVPKTGKA
jgi:itaconyl-CoA hydratase